MTRDQLLIKLEAAWQAFQDSYAGLSEAQMLEPGVTGEWSVKDIIAHVTTWEQEAVKYLPAIVRGESLPKYKDMYGGINAYNALVAEKKRHLPLKDVLDQQEVSHRGLVELVQRAPEEQLKTETRFRRRLKNDSYGHYPEHTHAIREWRQQRETDAGDVSLF